MHRPGKGDTVGVELGPLALSGEPATDKGFVTANGTKLRERVVQVAPDAASAPTKNSEARALAPESLTLSISLAALNGALAVCTDAASALLIMDAQEQLISGEALRNPVFDG